MSLEAIAWAKSQTLDDVAEARRAAARHDRRVNVAGEKAVLQSLAWFADAKTGKCHPRMKRICQDTAYSRRAVLGYLATLERHGYIIREQRRRADGYKAANGYTLLRYLHDGGASFGTVVRWPEDDEDADEGTPTVSGARDAPKTVDNATLGARGAPKTEQTDTENGDLRCTRRTSQVHETYVLGARGAHQELVMNLQEPSVNLSLQNASENEAIAEPSRARHSPGRESDNHPRRDTGTSKAKGRQAKGPRKGESLATPAPDYAAYHAAWNEHRGMLPDCDALSGEHRRRIRELERDHPNDALQRFTEAVRWNAQDHSALKRRRTLLELLKFGNVTDGSQLWRDSGDMTAAERSTAATAAIIARAIEDRPSWMSDEPEPIDVEHAPAFEVGDAARHAEYGDVTVTRLEGVDGEVTVTRDDGMTERVRAVELTRPPRARVRPTEPLPAAVTEYMRRPNGATSTPPVELVELESEPNRTASPREWNASLARAFVLGPPKPIAEPPLVTEPPQPAPKPKPTPEQRAERTRATIAALRADGRHDDAAALEAATNHTTRTGT